LIVYICLTKCIKKMAISSPVIELNKDNSGSLSSGSLSSNLRSGAYQYFNFKSSRWHCNYCTTNYSDASTFNLWRYITKKHPKEIEAHNEQNKVGEMDKYITSDKKENVSLILELILKFLVNNTVYAFLIFSLAKKVLGKE
jgi:hypothetical protein